jgi:hypothetical protein
MVFGVSIRRYPIDCDDEKEAVPMSVRPRALAFNEKIGGIS